MAIQVIKRTNTTVTVLDTNSNMVTTQPVAQYNAEYLNRLNDAR